MANRKRADARKKAQAKAARGEGTSPVMWIALGVVVLIGAGIAFFATRGDDSADATDTSTTAVSQFPVSQPVEIIGEPLLPFSSTAGDPAVGSVAPVLNGLNFRSQEVVANAGENGAYMLVFLAHWCPHCNAEVPRLLDWKNSGAVPEDLDVIGVATAVAEGSANYPPATWFSNKGWSWPVIVDEALGKGAAGKAAVAYGASGWPYIVIVGADGLVKGRVSGELEPAELRAFVDAAMAA